MATYTPENCAKAIRTNGPSNAVRSIAHRNVTFSQGPGRQWVGNDGKVFDNFASIVCEYPSGLEDAEDPYAAAVNYFTARELIPGDLVSITAKRHAIEIIKKSLY